MSESTEADRYGKIRESLPTIFSTAESRILTVHGKFAYDLKIWFPVPEQGDGTCSDVENDSGGDRSVYNRFGNLTRYGDEQFEREEWDSPKLDNRNDEDRADAQFLPGAITEIPDDDNDPETLNPNGPDPNWEGRAIIAGLKRGIRYFDNGGLGGSTDPYGYQQEIILMVPEAITDMPENSKVEVTRPDGDILQFHSLGVYREKGQWSAGFRRARLIPAQDEMRPNP